MCDLLIKTRKIHAAMLETLNFLLLQNISKILLTLCQSFSSPCAPCATPPPFFFLVSNKQFLSSLGGTIESCFILWLSLFNLVYTTVQATMQTFSWS